MSCMTKKYSLKYVCYLLVVATSILNKNVYKYISCIGLVWNAAALVQMNESLRCAQYKQTQTKKWTLTWER